MTARVSSGSPFVTAIARPGVALTLGAVVVAGSLVAERTTPGFLWSTLAVSMIVIFGATRAPVRARRPDSLAHLPAPLRALVTDTLEALPRGEAYANLRGVARLADAALGLPDHDVDHRLDADLEERVVELVEVCCEASRGLGRIEAAWPDGAALPVAHADAIATARETYSRQLIDATATLERLTLSVAQRDAREGERIAELAADIRREITARDQALAELDRLLEG